MVVAIYHCVAVVAIYHCVAVVGIPCSNDQRPNILRAARHGYAKIIEWNSKTAEDLVKKIEEAARDDMLVSAFKKFEYSFFMYI